MRTTVDLPEDLHRVALSLARDRSQTLSQVVGDLMRMALRAPAASHEESRRGGFPLFQSPRALTSEDVRSLDDDE